jgi:Zn-dependent peptidase ImmA (M78 family)
MFTIGEMDKITVFGDYQLYRKDRYKLRMMAEYLGVSQTCLLYRLDRLGMLDHKSYADYDPVMDYMLSWR